MTPPRHFLDIDGLDRATMLGLLDRAAEAKRERAGARRPGPFAGKVLAMVFEKPSMRTRVSFDVAMRDLGGGALILNNEDIGLAEREPVGDTARVLSRYVDAIMVRLNDHQSMLDLAAASSVPVINGLTDRTHPCQVMADLLTLKEHFGDLDRCTVAWCGDCNNVATSWVHGAGILGFELRIASPKSYGPSAGLIQWAQDNGAKLVVTDDPRQAVDGADCVVTDTWVSMGDSDAGARHRALMPYQVDEALMALAGERAIFMHCLPAHRGEEVSAGVIDGPQSAVFDEAENRLHAQKAILEWCLDEQ